MEDNKMDAAAYLREVRAPELFDGLAKSLLQRRPPEKQLVRFLLRELIRVDSSYVVLKLKEGSERRILGKYYRRFVIIQKNRAKQRRKSDDRDIGGQRFGDGSDAAITNANAVKRPVSFGDESYYQHKQRDPNFGKEAIEGLARWRCPRCRPFWPANTVADFVADADFVVDTHSKGMPPSSVRALYSYTHSQLCRREVWACYTPSASWHVIRSPVASAGSAVVELPPAALREMETAADYKGPSSLQLEFAAPFGLRVFSAPEGQKVVCYTNARAGDRCLSPLHDSVAWLPRGELLLETYGGTIANTLPYPGVLEYISSRGEEEALGGDGGGVSWTCTPFTSPTIERVVATCRSVKNQKARDERLWRDAMETVEREGSIDGIPVEMLVKIFSFRTADDCNQTPEEIARALTLQHLRWGSRSFLLALTTTTLGTKRAHTLIDTKTGKLYELFRVLNPFSNQIFWRTNEAMRETQFENLSATLAVAFPMYTCTCGVRMVPHSSAAAGSTCTRCQAVLDGPHWLCRTCGVAHCFACNPKNPRDATPTTAVVYSSPRPTRHQLEVVTADPVEFECEQVGVGKWDSLIEQWLVDWNGLRWNISDGSRAKLNLHGWLLPQVAPLIYLILTALRNAPGLDGQTQRTYRGMNCHLPPDVYSIGNIVLWGQFSSSSDDQGVAAGFAAGDANAAVFIIEGIGCQQISAWSRFARERELLYPPNSLFVVESALAEEAKQILGKESLQLFEMREVTHQEAESITVRRLLPEARNLAEANAILKAAEAVKSHNGRLELDLASDTDGKVPDHWARSSMVQYDPFDSCPIKQYLGSSVLAGRAGEVADQLLHRMQEAPERDDTPYELAGLHIARDGAVDINGKVQGTVDEVEVNATGLGLAVSLKNHELEEVLVPQGKEAEVLDALLRRGCKVPTLCTVEDAATLLGIPLDELRCDMTYTELRGEGTFALTVISKPELHVGDRVTRNPLGWLGGNSDGGAGCKGTVVKVANIGVQVEWDTGMVARGYSWGHGNAYALKPAEYKCSPWLLTATLVLVKGRPGFALGPQGAALLERVLKLGATIQSLSLAHHALGEEGALCILRGMRHNPHVKEVQFGETSTIPDYIRKKVQLLCSLRNSRLQMPEILELEEEGVEWSDALADCIYAEDKWLLPVSCFLWTHGKEGRKAYCYLMAQRRRMLPKSPVPIGALLVLCSSDWKGHQEKMEEELEYLLDNGATPLEVTTKNRTAVYFAAARPEFVATPQATDLTARMVQMEPESLQMFHMAASKYADGRTPLHMAAAKGCAEMVTVLVKLGADIRHQELFSKRTALMSAVRRWNFETRAEREAIQHVYSKAILDVVDKDGRTALAHAASKGKMRAVRFLVSRGADASLKDANGDTPLSKARERFERLKQKEYGEVVELLEKVSRGELPDDSDGEGEK